VNTPLPTPEHCDSDALPVLEISQMGVSVDAENHDRLEKMAIRPFSMCPRSGESIFASAMID